MRSAPVIEDIHVIGVMKMRSCPQNTKKAKPKRVSSAGTILRNNLNNLNKLIQEPHFDYGSDRDKCS